MPKTEVEFRANLGSVVSKSIELKNPSSKPIKYEVTLEGSTDFRANGKEVKRGVISRHVQSLSSVYDPGW